MQKFIVFSTLSGDVGVKRPDDFWKMFPTHRRNIVKIVGVFAHSAEGALLTERAYQVIVSASNHYQLQRDEIYS